MESMEDKLNSILGNPELMAQITTMAQALGNSKKESDQQGNNASSAHDTNFPLFPDLDPSVMQKIISVIRGTGIDGNQLTLLKALRPYLSNQRIEKLEKAMRAAKLAGFASTFLGETGLPFLTRR